jgi:hypothetical protein
LTDEVGCFRALAAGRSPYSSAASASAGANGTVRELCGFRASMWVAVGLSLLGVVAAAPLPRRREGAGLVPAEAAMG